MPPPLLRARLFFRIYFNRRVVFLCGKKFFSSPPEINRVFYCPPEARAFYFTLKKLYKRVISLRFNEYKRGLAAGIPICLGYISVSFAFGLMATKYGLSLISGLLISMTNLTSAGQFAGLEIIKSNGGLFELAFATFIINIRYMLMSLSLSQKIDENTPTLKRLIMSFGITDEIFAVSAQQIRSVTFTYFMGLMTLPYLGWSLGTFLGAAAASALPESVRLALGIAIYGMFIAIIVPPAKKSRATLSVIIVSVVISSLLYYIPVTSGISSGWRIIISTVAASALCAAKYPESEEESDNDRD